MSNSDLERIKQERIRMLTSTDQDIERIVADACGSKLSTKERITIGFSNEVYGVTTRDNQEVVVRIHWYGRPYFENEKWALDRLIQDDFPVPQVLHLAQDLPGDVPRVGCVETRLPGDSLETLIAANALTPTELESILVELGELLHRVHAVSMNGFGPIDAKGQSQSSSWHAAYVAGLPQQSAFEAAAHVGLPPNIVKETIDLLMQLASLGDKVTPSLLHGDFNMQNVLVKNGRITGLIDFEFAQSGDPAKEVPLGPRDSGGWNQFFGRAPVPVKPILAGYFGDRPMSDNFSQRMMWFRLANSLNGFAYHGINDKDNEQFMTFLRHQLPRDLAVVKEHLR